ncbi:MAG: dihydropteroate synthase [Bacteroidales bacterium]|nr:dihydropteroate synthase [Bacteroidales bacterium]MBQ9311971.1 dihydropteroate synthase [Bacteroidales bacterium]
MISKSKDTPFFKNRSINIKGNLFSLEEPIVMGILNVTEDSFFDGGKYYQIDKAIERAEQIVKEGGEIIDIGACSTRPGAILIDKQEEASRLLPVVKEIRKRFPSIPISIDTVWSEVAEKVFDVGADIINDISGGQWDTNLFSVVAKTKMPYILTHTNTTPDRMQKEIHYDNLFLDISKYFAQRIECLRNEGVKDIILDLGFGFGKTVENNYELLRRQKEFEVFSLPILTGISRKSMIYKPLNFTPNDALYGTTFLHAFALDNGADILRVHDVKVAKECVKLYKLYKNI